MNTKYKTPILLIEDNSGDVELIKFYLEEAGMKYELHHAETLFEGLETLQRIPIDLVLMDLNMPKKNGLDTTLEFRTWEQANNKTPTPIIGLTAHALNDDKNKCLKAGMNEYLSKPITRKDLVDKLRLFLSL